MNINNIPSKSEHNEIENLEELFLPLYYPLGQYGYTLKKAINNISRWYTKTVCTITDKYGSDFVSTTYTEKEDFLRFMDAVNLLEKNDQLLPKIISFYPYDNSIVCEYIGEYLHSYLSDSPSNVQPAIKSVYNYLKDLNEIKQGYRPFMIPAIINDVIGSNNVFHEDCNILVKTKAVLPVLEKNRICFQYGCGIEDPHVWNFRVLRDRDQIRSLTTDYDYFSNSVNCLWELGYFYATLRWLRENRPSLVYHAENSILSLIKNNNSKSLFMFWLGVLSSYCGYRDSIKDLLERCELYKIKDQLYFIEELDNKVSSLAKKVLEEKNRS